MNSNRLDMERHFSSQSLALTPKRHEIWNLSNSKKFKAFVFTVLFVTAITGGVTRRLIQVEIQEIRNSEQELNNLTQQHARAMKEVEIAKSAEQIMEQARVNGFAPEQWTELRTNMKQIRMLRPAANKLMSEAINKPGHISGAERFDISVSQPEESLFHPVSKIGGEIIISIQGRTLVRNNNIEIKK